MKFNKKEEKFIKANYLKISRKKIADKLNCSQSKVGYYLNKNNLIVPKELSARFRKESMYGRTTFTPEQTEFVLNNYLTMPEKTIARAIGKSGTAVRTRLRQLGLVIPKEIIQQRKKDSQFKIGNISCNKGKKQSEYMTPEAIQKTKATRFKKGRLPHNYKGGEHLSKDGYIMKSIGKGKVVLKHKYNWEKLNGKVPKGYCLASIDGSKENTEANNWELITREENMLRNSKSNYPKEIVRTKALISKVKKSIIKLEQQ